MISAAGQAEKLPQSKENQKNIDGGIFVAAPFCVQRDGQIKSWCCSHNLKLCYVKNLLSGQIRLPDTALILSPLEHSRAIKNCLKFLTEDENDPSDGTALNRTRAKQDDEYLIPFFFP